MSATDSPDPASPHSPGDNGERIVAGRIVDRYSTPARQAFTYLFRLKAGASLDALIPDAESVLSAWVDEGSGFQPTPPDQAVARCREASQIRPHADQPHRMTPTQRRQMMARAIQFTAVQTDPATVVVDLASRSLGFSPKGVHTVQEIWKCTAGGVWYSAYRPDRDEE